MIIKTDLSHKCLNNLKTIDKKPIKIAQKTGVLATTVGLAIVLSGCTIENKIIMNEYERINEPVMQMYYDGVLSEQSLEKVFLPAAPIDEDFIDNLPSDLKELNLRYNTYINDLSNLPYVCPSLEKLSIERCYSISNFDFIKDFKNLKSFKIYGETIGVNEELINYLDSKGIDHNLDSNMVNIDTQVQNIADSIINDNMDEREKMDAITNYVINNMKYDKSALINPDASSDYNDAAFSSALNGKGVCANYAALTGALCAKAGITSYFAYDSDHAWNLVQIEGKYYYIDATNICQVPILSKLIMEKFGKGFFYMQDPYHTNFSVMTDIDKINTPQRLLQLIKEAEDKKSFIEKYGSNVYVDIITIFGIYIGLSTFVKVRKKIKG